MEFDFATELILILIMRRQRNISNYQPIKGMPRVNFIMEFAFATELALIVIIVILARRAHGPLLEPITMPQTDEDMAAPHPIICPIRMVTTRPRRWSSPGVSFACSRPGSLFVGLTFGISAGSKFKKHLIESGVLGHLKTAQEQLQADSPNFEIIELARQPVQGKLTSAII
jgi:hypothetical protein